MDYFNLIDDQPLANAKREFEVYNKLCDKAKELIFIYNNIGNKKHSFIEVYGLNDEVKDLSPIEQIFLVAFNIYSFYSNKEFYLEYEYQKPIYVNEKQYRVDFVITGFNPNSEYESISLKKPLIIECDGFEHHSSKKQVNNDYKRENKLKTAGYDIMRFTGSQIYSNPFECIDQVYSYIESVIKE